jgi:hypothetical protein
MEKSIRNFGIAFCIIMIIPVIAVLVRWFDTIAWQKIYFATIIFTAIAIVNVIYATAEKTSANRLILKALLVILLYPVLLAGIISASWGLIEARETLPSTTFNIHVVGYLGATFYWIVLPIVLFGYYNQLLTPLKNMMLVNGDENRYKIVHNTDTTITVKGKKITDSRGVS